GVALYLATRFPKVFGFLVWQFGVCWVLGESYSSYYLRAFKYWMTVCTVAALIVAFGYFTVQRVEGEFVDAILSFLAPLILLAGYLRVIWYLALYVYHKRNET